MILSTNTSTQSIPLNRLKQSINEKTWWNKNKNNKN